MTEAAGIFDASADFDPTADFDAFCKQVPARHVVYLLADADDRPVQLLCVRNLRASLKRRLGPPEPEVAPSKRVNYRELVRRVYFRRVDSAFEADVVYHDAARVLFPNTYRGMVGFRPAWFIQVNPDANFPRYEKTIDPTKRTGFYLGPLEDKHAAARLIELMEDSFDLCRYYHILVQSPTGKACAYKEMGKCPAPCDGSISMESYRRLVHLSIGTLIDPKPFLRDQENRMRSAARDLKFEIAAKIKQYVDSLGQLGKGAFRHVRPLEEFRYLSLQHGQVEGSASVFVVTPGEVEHVATLINEPTSASSLLRLIFERGHIAAPVSPTIEQVERISVVSHHLVGSKAVQGIFLPLGEVEDKSLTKAYRDLLKQKRPDETDEAEGIVKEFAALP